MSFTAFNGQNGINNIINNDGFNELQTKVTGVQLLVDSIMINIQKVQSSPSSCSLTAANLSTCFVSFGEHLNCIILETQHLKEPVLGYFTDSLTEDHHFCIASQSDLTWFVTSRKKTSLVRGDTINNIIMACG